MQRSEKVVLFLGSGFSVDLGLPVTSALQRQLLRVTEVDPVERQRETFINRAIAEFWNEAFGWTQGNEPPALEDHFTQIDLAANTGHYLGNKYGPKKLRALRRMTIYRVFRMLNLIPVSAPHIENLFCELVNGFQLSVVTTNWDIMAERCLERQGRSHIYNCHVDLQKSVVSSGAVPVWKLHGSGNWGYCDLCRKLITSELGLGKTAVKFGWLLEAEDFRLFRGGGKVASDLRNNSRECPFCGGQVAVRVATFSYRKYLDPPFFQSIWEAARNSLCSAERWLFVGYSLPEADIEIRQLLKTTELARRMPARPRIDVVLKGDESAESRYKRLFGRSIATISNGGIEQWVLDSLPTYCV